MTGPYEGLFYIDNDDYHVYCRSDAVELDEEDDIRLARDLSYEELCGVAWRFDMELTNCVWDDIESDLVKSFTKRFGSFERVTEQRWIGCSVRGLMESRLFCIGIEDNEWSMAVKLLQKKNPYYRSLEGLQKRHFERYLDGIKCCLLEQLASIGTYRSAWTSGTIRGENL